MRIILLILALLALCVPLAAQGAADTVAFNGIEFDLPQELAAGVMILRTGGDDPALEQPGGAVPRHITFTLISDVPNDMTNTIVGEIHVYSTSGFAGYSLAENRLATLSGLLETRPDLTSYTQVAADGTDAFELPYLPGVGAGQILRAKPQYIETEGLTGIRYLTTYAQDVSPFTANSVWYTFQGLSNDGAYYVTVNVMLNATVLPAEIPADFDYDAFNTTYTQYLSETAALLNDAAVETFVPNPLTLDALAQSIRVPLGTGTNTSSTALGGLEGTWNLVSYGPADAQVPVLETAPVTLVFAPDGISGKGSCNNYFGGFTFTNEGELTITGVGSTLMACEEGIMTQEITYFGLLDAATGFALDGDTLTVNYGVEGGAVAPGVLTFTRAA